MALIKRADAGTHLAGAVTLDLGDLEQRARLLREAATAEAERIVREAQEERRRLVQGAEAEGRAAGHAEGFEAGRAEGFEAGRAEAVDEFRERLKALDVAWSEAMQGIIDRREALLAEARSAVVELAVAIAERVVHRHVEVTPGAVEDQLRALLGMVAAPATLIVRVHPDDEALVREVLPRLRERFVGGIHLRLQTDSALSRGSCAARTLGGASIDGTIETQLERLVRDLVPGIPAGPDREGGQADRDQAPGEGEP
jgi:flagellar assembly protein FliH